MAGGIYVKDVFPVDDFGRAGFNAYQVIVVPLEAVDDFRQGAGLVLDADEQGGAVPAAGLRFLASDDGKTGGVAGLVLRVFFQNVQAEQFRREGMDFLNYLKVCRGKLGTDADEELAAMQKTCASIMGFVHNHPEQLNRVRRFREYYLPTTRKLLDTAQGLGDTDSANAAEIRRDITGILHTLNQAYEKLYDTLLQDVSMDVSTEIDTLEAMLRQDGLTHDFEADFNTRS